MKFPKFSSDKELAEWIENHDTGEYMDDLEVVSDEIKVQRTGGAKESIDVQLSSNDLEAIKRVASTRGIPYQTLIQTWLIEKLHQEARDAR